jgi:PAS domain S-box-containing protein
MAENVALSRARTSLTGDEVIGKADPIGEGLLSTLLDLIPDYFYVADSDMRFVYVNKTAAEYFQVPKHEIVGKSFADVEPNTDFARRFADLGRKIMVSGTPHVSEFGPYNEPDGTLSFFRRFDIPFRHPVTDEPMMIGLVQDMTDRVERERQVRSLAALQREMQIAHEIQRSLLPKELRTSWVELFGFSEPAAYAGGDFYDWQLLPDGSIVVTLGDVTGHGVGPALVAAQCRAYWRVVAPSMPLREAVARLNGLVADDLLGDRFITFVAAKLSADGVLEVFSAGQGPLALRRHDGTVEVFDSHALPLGITQDLLLGAEEPTVRRLVPGDKFVMASDGLPETYNADGRQWTNDGLLHCLARHHGSASDLLQAIDQANLEFAAGVAPADDRTLVVAAFQ